MKIEIKSRFDARIIFSGEYESFRLAVEAAIKLKINMRGADMSGADMRDANMRGANMRDANMSYANMSYADMRGADMSGANMRDANMRGANMRGADMRGADMRDANMRGANMRDANMRGADMRGADILIGKTKLSWNSHQLISEILLRASGQDANKRAFAGLVRISTDWCWNDFAKIKISPAIKKWALMELHGWICEGDEVPELIKDGK